MSATRASLVRHAAKKYHSSPHQFTEAELTAITDGDYSCCMCGESVFEMDDFPAVIDGDVYCSDCETDEFRQTCPLCEDLFDKPKCAAEYRFAVSKALSQGAGLAPGIYQVTEFPFLLADTFGVIKIWDDTVLLVRSCDVDAMKSKMLGRKTTVDCDAICPRCFDKYTLQKRHRVAYFYKSTRLHRNITERGILAHGW